MSLSTAFRNGTWVNAVLGSNERWETTIGKEVSVRKGGGLRLLALYIRFVIIYSVAKKGARGKMLKEKLVGSKFSQENHKLIDWIVTEHARSAKSLP